MSSPGAERFGPLREKLLLLFPVQMMLSSRAPLEELVGKRHIVTVGHQTFTVFPIYHPSPISPKSWSENLLLIPALQATLKEGESCLSI